MLVLLACVTDVQVAANEEAMSTQARLGLASDEVGASALEKIEDYIPEWTR
ncbi:MAG: hypothetical protein FJ102_16540 [Deltaproteobacteria bacterium]|nr:hypothetical protein [Deltaproteobacteria bacterium]